MPSVRDNTEFLYNTPDIVNPVFESNKRTHNVVHLSEAAGWLVSQATNLTLFTQGAIPYLPEERSFKAVWANKKELWGGGVEQIEKYNMLPAGLGAVTSATLSMVYGKTYSEKLQGASLGVAEFAAERIAVGLSEGIIKHFMADATAAQRGTAKWLAREVGGNILGIALIPVFNFGFKTIGAEIDKHVKHSGSEAESLPAPHPQEIRRKSRHKAYNPELKGKLKHKSKIEDENPSRRDVEDALARRIVYNRAF